MIRAGMFIWSVVCESPDDYIEEARAFIKRNGYTQNQVKIFIKSGQINVVAKVPL